MIQGTEEWRLAKLGKVGASRVADVVAKTKSGWGTSRNNYASELIRERLTGVPIEGYVSFAMKEGTEKEPLARAAYEFRNNVKIEEVGFILHPRIINAGASPDGLIGRDGLVEIKCPIAATHLETLQTKKVPEKYVTQMQFQLAVTGRKWCDYVSYDPSWPEKMQLFVARMPRETTIINYLEKEVATFLREVDLQVEAIVREYGVLPKVLAA